MNEASSQKDVAYAFAKNIGDIHFDNLPAENRRSHKEKHSGHVRSNRRCQRHRARVPSDGGVGERSGGREESSIIGFRRAGTCMDGCILQRSVGSRSGL